MASGFTEACDIHFQKSAVQWCSICDQALCSDCIEYHSQSKTSKHHETIPMADFLKLPPFIRSINKVCEQHDNRMEYFCSFHEEFCCFYCLQSTHKQCERVERVEKLAKNIKHSILIEDLESNIEDLLFNMDNLIQKKTQNISNVDKQTNMILLKIAEHKKRVIADLNKIEAKLKNELIEKAKQERSHLDKFIHDMKKRKRKIITCSEELNTIKEFATDIDVFTCVYEQGKTIQNEKSSLQAHACIHTAEVTLETPMGSKLLGFNVFGKIVVNSKPTKVNLRETKQSQAQFYSLERTEKNKSNKQHKHISFNQDINTRFELAKDIVTELPCEYSLSNLNKNSQIVACKLLSKDEFILLEFDSKCLVRYSSSKHHIPLTGKPIDFTLLEGNICAVTLYKDNAVCLIDLTEKTEITRYKVQGECFGIDNKDSTIYVTLPHMKAIQILKSTVESYKMYTVSTTKSAFYVKCFKDKLFCSNHIQNIVFSVTTSGVHIWEIHSDHLLEPLCLAVVTNGDLYVTCRKNKSVVLISSGGKLCKPVIQNVRAIQGPRAIDYCPTLDKFLLCDEKSGICSVFNFKEHEETGENA